MAKIVAATSSRFETVYGIYLAVVCAISLLVLAIMLGSLINSSIDFAFPRELNYPVEKVVYDIPNQPRTLTDAEVSERQATQMRIQRTNEIRGFAHDGIYFLIAAAVYLGHRRLFRLRLKS